MGRRLELGLTRPGEAGPYACHRSQAWGEPRFPPRTRPPETCVSPAWGGVWNWDSHGPAKPGLTPAIGVRRGGNPGSPHGPALLRLASRRHGEASGTGTHTAQRSRALRLPSESGVGGTQVPPTDPPS